MNLVISFQSLTIESSWIPLCNLEKENSYELLRI